MKTVVLRKVPKNSNYAVFPVRKDGEIVGVMVHFNRAGKPIQRYFAAGRRGYQEAGAEARMWRDEQLRSHPVTISESDFEKLTVSNSSGVRGVRYYRRTSKSPYIGVEVQWPCIDGRREEKKKLMFAEYDSREDCLTAGKLLRKTKIREYLNALEILQNRSD